MRGELEPVWLCELRSAWEEWLDAVYPPQCPLCGTRTSRPEPCSVHEIAAREAVPRCGRCALPLPEVISDGATCAACRRDPPGFARTLALGDYRGDGPLREWVLAFKHGGRSDLARELGCALAARLAREAARDELEELLVPVPLHLWRRIERGYDQAFLLAREIARRDGLRCVRALRRSRATLPQGAPGTVSRRANVRDAFRLRPGARKCVEGRRVWLVDDVATSGATARECARVLRAAGAREVSLLVVARAGSDQTTGSPLRAASSPYSSDNRAVSSPG